MYQETRSINKNPGENSQYKQILNFKKIFKEKKNRVSLWKAGIYKRQSNKSLKIKKECNIWLSKH